jgi:hypothetical protein
MNRMGDVYGGICHTVFYTGICWNLCVFLALLWKYPQLSTVLPKRLRSQFRELQGTPASAPSSHLALDMILAS